MVVSFDDEPLILVDSDDNELGTLDKAACHDGEGVLHRAFSLFVFNPDGQLLVQQRASTKRLWPLFWANSCCSHPRAGEAITDAVDRRLQEELGLTCAMQFVYKFEYHARYQSVGSEHELCSVFVGSTDAEPKINDSEIHSWRWIDQTELTASLRDQSDVYTPWLHQEWPTLLADHNELLPSSG